MLVKLSGACASVVLAGAMLASAAHAAPRYHVVPLGPAQVASSAAYALNAKGVAAGQDGSHAATFDAAGNTTDLGTLPAGNWSYAYAINAKGQVAGLSSTGASIHAFRWTKGTMVDLGTLPAGTTGTSTATGINKAGQVVGWSYAGGGYTHATLWKGSKIIDLGTLPGAKSSQAEAINEAGHIVGTSDGRGFLYRDGKMIDLQPGAPAPGTAAYGINDADQVVGSMLVQSTTGGSATSQAFLYDNGTITPLGFARAGDSRSQALGINKHGVVVGISSSNTSFTPVGFVYDGTQMSDINTLLDAASAGWQLTNANAINDDGEVVGYGYFNGYVRPFLATPITP